MAYGDNVSATWSVEDLKAKPSSFSMSFPETTDIPVLKEFIGTTAEIIDPIINTRFTGASIRISVNLDGVTLKDAPVMGSDVEEGATFTFRSTEGAPTKIRLPGFTETFGLETGTAVDLSAPAVDDFVQRILEGHTVIATNVRFSDNRGNNVSGLVKAKGNFTKSRKGA